MQPESSRTLHKDVQHFAAAGALERPLELTFSHRDVPATFTPTSARGPLRWCRSVVGSRATIGSRRTCSGKPWSWFAIWTGTSGRRWPGGSSSSFTVSAWPRRLSGNGWPQQTSGCRGTGAFPSHTSPAIAGRAWASWSRSTDVITTGSRSEGRRARCSSMSTTPPAGSWSCAS